MTDPELLDELERLDKAATGGPMNRQFRDRCYVCRQKPTNEKEEHALALVYHTHVPFEQRDANAELFAWIGTHRARILHLLKRELRGRELLERALQSCSNDLLEDEITHFLEESQK